MVSFETVGSEHVLQAIGECDQMGAAEFVRRYGFGPAREYVLWHNGVGYDSKAILNVATRHATGSPALASDFGDGESSEAKVLGDLGFEVVPDKVVAGSHTAPGIEEWTEGADAGAEESRAAWAIVARDVLSEAAKRYHAVVTYKELAGLVQMRTGIRTSQLVHYWLGDVLGRVSRECDSKGEPLLSALCVNAQGSVGKGYAGIVEELRGETIEDPDEHAARERLACYVHFGADIPEGGGEPVLTATLATARAVIKRSAQVERPVTTCPTCNMAIPPTGICDNCD